MSIRNFVVWQVAVMISVLTLVVVGVSCSPHVTQNDDAPLESSLQVRDANPPSAAAEGREVPDVTHDLRNEDAFSDSFQSRLTRLPACTTEDQVPYLDYGRIGDVATSFEVCVESRGGSEISVEGGTFGIVAKNGERTFDILEFYTGLRVGISRPEMVVLFQPDDGGGKGPFLLATSVTQTATAYFGEMSAFDVGGMVLGRMFDVGEPGYLEFELDDGGYLDAYFSFTCTNFVYGLYGEGFYADELCSAEGSIPLAQLGSWTIERIADGVAATLDDGMVDLGGGNLLVDLDMLSPYRGHVPLFVEFFGESGLSSKIYGVPVDRDLMGGDYHYFVLNDNELHYIGDFPHLVWDGEGEIFVACDGIESERTCQFYRLEDGRFHEEDVDRERSALW